MQDTTQTVVFPSAFIKLVAPVGASSSLKCVRDQEHIGPPVLERITGVRCIVPDDLVTFATSGPE